MFNESLAKKNQEFTEPLSTQILNRKREESSVQLRKKQRDSITYQKRFIESESLNFPAKLVEKHQELACAGSVSRKLEVLVRILTNPENEEEAFNALVACRIIISTPGQSSIHKFVSGEFVPVFIRLSLFQVFQEEVSWCLCNLAAGNSNHVNVLVQHHIVDALKFIMKDGSQLALEHCLWCISNLAGDGPALKALLAAQILPFLIEMSGKELPEPVYMFLSEAIYKIIEGEGLQTDSLLLGLRALKKLMGLPCADVVHSSLIGLYHFTKRENYKIQFVINESLHITLCELLDDQYEDIVKVALKVVGNIAAGENTHGQALLDCGILDKLEGLILYPNELIRKEVYWTLANLTVGGVPCIAGHSILIEALKGFSDPSILVKTEASHLFFNLSQLGAPEDLLQLYNLGIVSGLGEALEEPDEQILANALKTLKNLIMIDERGNIRENLLKFGVIDLLGGLSSHKAPQVSDLACEALSLSEGLT